MIYRQISVVAVLCFTSTTSVFCSNSRQNQIFFDSYGSKSRSSVVGHQNGLINLSSWCTCSNEVVDIVNELDCHCEGRNFVEIPQNLKNITRLSIANAGIRSLTVFRLNTYSAFLKDLFLINLSRFCYIEPYVFQNFTNLRSIYISNTANLQNLQPEVFYHSSKSFKTLRIVHSGLLQIPDLRFLSHNVILLQLDFEGNLIPEIPENSFNIKTEQLILDNNLIQSIHQKAFNGSEIGKLSLKGNKKLKFLHELAFDGIMTIRELDLSSTSILTLSTKGLEKLEILRIQNTPSLKEIPSVYNFKNLEKAFLTHSFHCCAFKFPSRHDPRSYQKYLQLFEQWKVDCNAKESLNGSLKYPITDVSDAKDETDMKIGDENEIDMEGIFLAHPVNPLNIQVQMCGSINIGERKVKCVPQPDALNPCEDVFGIIWLKIFVWIVITLSVVGNVAVLVVLLSNHHEFTVPKILVCNLAFADLCMGIYLLLIALIDLYSKNEYFNHAFDWQYGIGCKTSGFLTVFAAHLSIFTLTIITIERWFAITKAIFLNRRLKKRTAIYIMICGWIYSIVMASLPLFGMSNYSSTSICLPMELIDWPDFIYIITVLTSNGIGFLIVVVCYVQIYLSLGKQDFTYLSNRELVVAKKMAMLVFTNFACFAPITFFGIFALTGHSLINVTNAKILLVFFYPLNSCANPYLYVILTSQYRQDAIMLFSRCGNCKNRPHKNSTRTNKLTVRFSRKT